jgi:phosphatidate cytidylyltransferase
MAASAVPRGSSDLLPRILSGIVMAALALGTAVAGGWFFALFWTVTAIIAAREWLILIGFDGGRLRIVWFALSAGLATGGILAENAGGPSAAALAPPLVAGLLAALAVRIAPNRLWALGGGLYTGLIAVVPIGLRSMPEHGLTAMLWLFAVVWCSDTAAYFVGRRLGGPKLWPRISPKKTWSGFLGGLIGGVGAALLTVSLADAADVEWLPTGLLVALSILASLVSVAGDLFESFMKRRFGVKDSSHLIPGHGGVLDRLDSFTAVCALLLVAAIAGLLGGVRT